MKDHLYLPYVNHQQANVKLWNTRDISSFSSSLCGTIGSQNRSPVTAVKFSSHGWCCHGNQQQLHPVHLGRRQQQRCCSARSAADDGLAPSTHTLSCLLDLQQLTSETISLKWSSYMYLEHEFARQQVYLQITTWKQAAQTSRQNFSHFLVLHVCNNFVSQNTNVVNSITNKLPTKCVIYTVSGKKRCHLIFCHNFATS